MKINSKDFKVEAAQKNALKFYPSLVEPLYQNEKEARELLNKTLKNLSTDQELLYAQNEWSVLVVLQGLDTAGKDGLVKHVMKGVNPQGCSVTSFKKPTHLELAHDFLWRAHLQIPARGQIGVFNRSYYEDIVVPFVHPESVATMQLPIELRNKKLLERRCEDIINFENYLARQGVIVIKIFLNLSRAEQKKRLLSRLDEEAKNWKFSEADLLERQFWAQYQKAYNFCIEKTSHDQAPWHIIPADDKLNARLIASKIISQRIHELNLSFPKIDAKQKALLTKYRKKLI